MSAPSHPGPRPATHPAAPLLTVEDLHVRFDTPTGEIHAVRGISFTLGREKLGLVGESGSGKSQTGRALLRLTPPTGRVTATRLDFDGIDLLAARPRQMRALRGARLSMVMQDPTFSLNPVMPVGRQIAEAWWAHAGAGRRRREARDRALAMLEAVRIREPGRVYDAYPHELSGGMGQRVMIAMMLVPEPDLLIADEPTSALDVTVQMQVLAILDDLVSRRGMGLIFISHDLRLVSSFCDRVAILYAGRILDTCRADALAADRAGREGGDRSGAGGRSGAGAAARHPYTRGLLTCLPQVDAGGRRGPLPVLQRDPAWLS